MYGSMNVWEFACVGVWMYGVWVYGSIDGVMGVQMYGSIEVWGMGV